MFTYVYQRGAAGSLLSPLHEKCAIKGSKRKSQFNTNRSILKWQCKASCRHQSTEIYLSLRYQQIHCVTNMANFLRICCYLRIKHLCSNIRRHWELGVGPPIECKSNIFCFFSSVFSPQRGKCFFRCQNWLLWRCFFVSSR